MAEMTTSADDRLSLAERLQDVATRMRTCAMCNHVQEIEAIAATLSEVNEGCYLMRDGKKFPVELDYSFLGIMPITIKVGGFRYLLEVPDGE